MYCLDLWPESLVAGGLTRESGIYKYYHYVSKKIYKQMDKILVTSKMFTAYFSHEFGIEDDKVEYLPQYAEGIFESLPPKKPTGIFDFMFAGNIGSAQSIDTILNAAEDLKDEPVKIHIVGGGSELETLKRKAKDMNNVVFYGRRPVEEMPVFYAKADAMLVTMKADPVLSLTLPGKVQSYMAVGKPIIGAVDGETKNVIEDAQCGYCGKAEDAEELAFNIRRFISEADIEVMGQKARKFYEENFQRAKFMNEFEMRIAETQMIL